MNSDIKKVLDRVKKAQSQVQTFVKDRAWVASAKKYAERQSKEMKKIINADVAKVKTFLNNEKKELARLQKKFPGEVDKIKTFVESQKKELQSLLEMARKEAETQTANAKAAAKKKLGEFSKKGKSPQRKVAKKASAAKSAAKPAAKTASKKTAKKKVTKKKA